MMKVLELGCGNSQLSEKLYEDGVKEITCIDLSAVAVEKLQKRLVSKGYKGAVLHSKRSQDYHLYLTAIWLFAATED